MTNLHHPIHQKIWKRQGKNQHEEEVRACLDSHRVFGIGYDAGSGE